MTASVRCPIAAVLALLLSSFSMAAASPPPSMVAVGPEWVLLKGGSPVGRSLHGAAYDPVRHQMVIAGGGSSDWWALRLHPNPDWRNVLPASTFVYPCAWRTIVYDPPRDRFISLGENCGGEIHPPGILAASIDGALVTSQLPADGPRLGIAAFYDPVRDRLVTFGGQNTGNGTYPQDVRVLNLTGTPEWTTLATAGTPPPGRSYHNLIYDPALDRMIVLLGRNGAGPLDDIWQLTLSGTPTWSPLVPLNAGPTARSAAAAALTPLGTIVVAFGDDGSPRSDVWSLYPEPGGPTWTELNVGGGAPPPRSGASMVFDPSGEQMVLFGGANGVARYNDIWALSFPAGVGTWSQINTQPSPTRRAWAAMARDPVHDRAILFGGISDIAGLHGDLWQLPLGGGPWAPMPAFGPAPSPRQQHTLTYDPMRDRMILFGGRDVADLGDVWQLTLGPTPQWQLVSTAGTLPGPRSGHSAIYDPIRDRLVVFGGSLATASSETWALSLATNQWTLLHSGAGGPQTRIFSGALYDPVGDRMIVWAGEGRQGPYHRSFNDTWALSLASPAWTQLAPAGGTPSDRRSPMTVYDPGRHRLVTFGGATVTIGGINQTYGNRNDVRELTLATPTWSLLIVAGWGPAGRDGTAGIYDPSRDRMILFGGCFERSSETGGSYMVGETYAIYFTPELVDVPPEPTTMRFAIQRVSPNPARAGIDVWFHLPRAQSVSIELLDLAGRRRASTETGVLAAGPNRVRFDDTAHLSAGMYFLRLTGRDGIGSARVCVVR